MIFDNFPFDGYFPKSFVGYSKYVESVCLVVTTLNPELGKLFRDIFRVGNLFDCPHCPVNAIPLELIRDFVPDESAYFEHGEAPY